MPFSQISTSVTIINTGLIGYCGISLTEFTTSANSLIAAGSGIEIAGAFFKADANITPNATSWTVIGTATTAYLELTPSGTAGTQIISAAWTATVPIWSTSKQGWYASAGSVVRTVASVYKAAGATVQSNKQLLGLNQSVFESYRFQGKIERITSGASNWTVPADVYRIKVTCVGGGGGGAGGWASGYSPTNGSNGGTTTFTGATSGVGGSGGLLSGGGGSGATDGAGSAGSSCGGSYTGGAGGGAGGRGGVPTLYLGENGNYGGGGGGTQSAISSGNGGGGGGGTIISNVIGNILTVTPSTSIAYSVGTGGAAGHNGNGQYAGTGGSGIIIIEY